MSKLHDFKTSLAIGEIGQKKLQELWPELVPTDGRTGDFLLPGGLKVEVKSDSYKHQDTENFFIERYSDVNKKTNGGPWQSAEHGCSVFVYFFVNDGIAYVFDLDKLLLRLAEICPTGLIYIRNKGWTTGGYKVPRVKLLDIATILRDPNVKD
jgi:hypothetical protein